MILQINNSGENALLHQENYQLFMLYIDHVQVNADQT